MIFRERETETERQRQRQRETETLMLERNINHTYPGLDGSLNLDMCPKWGLNPQPFCVWDDAPTT